MKLLQTLAAMPAAIYFASSVIAEDVKSPEWLFFHAVPIADVCSDKILVMPVTRDILALTVRPSGVNGYLNTNESVDSKN